MRSVLLTALVAAAASLLLCDCQKKREPVPGPQTVASQTAPAHGRALSGRLLRF